MQDIKIIQLSPKRWNEYRDLRLEALTNDPKAFGQTYEKAINFPDSYWEDHLINTLDRHKLLVYFAESSGKLIGMMGAFFQQTPETMHVAQIFSVYINKDFRGLGIASKLQAHLLAEIKKIEGIDKIKVMVNKSQKSAVRLYEKGNFKIIKSENRILGDGSEYEVATLEQELY